MKKPLIKITRAGLIEAGNRVCFLSDVAPNRWQPGEPRTVKRWFTYAVESVESFGSDLRILNLARQRPEGGTVSQTLAISKTQYLPRLVGWYDKEAGS